MVRSLAVLSLATAVLALPNPVSHSAISLVDAFRAIRRDAQLTGEALAKRQSLSDYDLTEEDQRVLTGLQDLLQKATSATLSDGSTLSVMEDCGSCFGSDSREDATDFAEYCSVYGALSSGSASAGLASSTPRSVTASGSAVRSMTASGAPAASGSATRPVGGLSSASSTQDAFGGLNDVGSSPTASGSAQSTPEGGGNGAGALAISASLVFGALSGAAVLLAV
ncbi:hypothetical protein JCM11251_003630 [Rhodosporidiobolus azoricus]